MIKIEVLINDMIINNFKISDYGLMIGTFKYTDSEDDIGMSITTIENFIGHNPKPIYLGQKYSDKLRLQITLIKNPCIFQDEDLYFYEKDCRWILRSLTGIKGYQWLKLIVQSDEDLLYRAKINNVLYNRINNHIVGIILNIECDSCFAWSKEYNITINAEKNQHFYIFNNTDDLNNYIYPFVSIHSSSNNTLSITNLNDNWITEIKNVKVNETINIDSQHQIISSTIQHNLLLDDFNLGWIRLTPGKNDYITNSNIIISMRFRVPRKVGIVCEYDIQNRIIYNSISQSKNSSFYNDHHTPITLSQIDSLFKE